MRSVSRAVLAATCLSLVCSALPMGWTVAASATPPTRALVDRQLGHAGKCHGGSGVTVVVNFKAFHGKIAIRCAPGHPDNGIQALRQAGYTVKGTKKTGLAFVCRINRKPSPQRQKCINVPPPNAYWAYYHAKRGAKKWTYSSQGPLSYHPPQGSIEAWAWGDGRKPGISPPKVRQSKTAAPAPPAASTLGPEGDPVVAAASTYLAHQLRFHPTLAYLGYDDFGLLADAVIALHSAGVDPAQQVRSTNRLAIGVSAYAGSGSRVSAGALAKLLLVADVEGRDPRSFGGHDLIEGLTSLMDHNGRYVDRPGGGDLSNTFSQSLALTGIADAGMTVPAKALRFLARQQCGQGVSAGFRLLMAARACTDPGQADVDSTSMAVRALLAVGAARPASRGLTWLEQQQTADGGLAGSPPTDVVNANSTGLALAALVAGHRYKAAARAAGYLESLQLGCSVPESVRGAVSYSELHHARDLKHPQPTQELTRATTQALIGLAVFRAAKPVVGSPPGCGQGTGATTAATSVPVSHAAPSTDSSTTRSSVALAVGGTAALIAVTLLFLRRRA